MKVHDEIKSIVSESLHRKSLRGMSDAKLLKLFRDTEFTLPDEISRDELDLNRLMEIRRSAAAKPGIRDTAVWRSLRWALAPGMAAILLLAFVVYRTGIFTPAVEYGRIISIHGVVETVSASDKTRLKQGDLVRAGDMIRAGAEAGADISFGDAVSVRVLENAEFSLGTIKWRAGSGIFRSMVSAGTLLVYAHKCLPGDSISIGTPVAEAVIRGTYFSVTVDKDRTTRYRVFEGKIKVKNRMDAAGPDKEKTEKYFDENAVFVASHQVCTVDGAVTAPDEKSVEKALASVSPPVVSEKTDREDAIAMEARDFIGDSSDSVSLAACRFIVLNDKAELFIDGVKKPYVNRDLYLAKGPHEVSIKVPGFEEKKAHIDLEATNTVYAFILGGAGTAAGAGGSAYRLHVPETPNTIYVAPDGNVEALHGHTKKWVLHLHRAVLSMPAILDRVMILSTADGKMMGIDSKDGSILWNKSIGESVQAPSGIVAGKDGVFAGMSSGMMYKFMKNGNTAWRTNIGKSVDTMPLSDGTHLFASSGDTVTILDGSTGAPFRKFSTDSPVKMMIKAQNRLLLAAESGSIYCYDTGVNEMKWQYKGDGNGIAGMYAADDSVFTINSKGTVTKLDGQGNLKWTRATMAQGNLRIFGASRVYAIGSDMMQELDGGSGSIHWSFILQPGVSDRITYIGDNPYFISAKGSLVSITE